MELNLKKVALLIIIALYSISGYGQVTIVVEELPSVTPPEDSLFISGTFNNWNTDNPAYMLTKRLDGKYSITLTDVQGTIEFKFTRGTWLKVETNGKNEYVPNRKHTVSKGGVISVVIENWQDLAGVKPFDFSVFYFFTVAFLGSVTAFFLTRIKNRKKQEVKLLNTFLLFISLILLGRVVYEMVSIKTAFMMESFGVVLMFISGPLWYFVLAPSSIFKRSSYAHALPAIFLLLIITLKIFNVSTLEFLTARVSGSFVTWDSFLIYGLAFLSNGTYFVLGRTRIAKQQDVEPPAEARFFKLLLLGAALFLLFVFVKIVILFSVKGSVFIWLDRNLLFISASLFVLLASYYVFRHEDIFKTVTQTFKKDDALALKNLIHTAMKDRKLYKDPHLSLNDLSEALQMKPHLLSKVINECYQQNFRDFVNKYRVEEFISLAKQDDKKRFTFLALANEVGFNSKSTFNTAFKKVVQQSPREFFKSNQPEMWS